MSAKAERVLIGLLTDHESLNVVMREGFNPEIMPSEELAPVVEWALRYLSGSGKAPTPDTLTERFGNLLDDLEIDVHELPEESVEWALEGLVHTYGKRVSADILKAMARDVAMSTPETILDVLGEHSATLSAAVSDLSPQTSRVDLRERGQLMLDRYHLAVEQGEEIAGMTFGLREIDDHYGGVRDGEVAVFASPAKMGKASPLTTPVLTPSGWSTIGDLQVGDEVIGKDGHPTRVIQLHPIVDLPVYRITTADGGTTVCSGQHLWTIQTRDQRTTGTSMTIETTELAQRVGRGQTVYLPMVDPVQHPEADLPIDPYVLGALLGDGSLSGGDIRVTKQDVDLHERVARLNGHDPIYYGDRGKTKTSTLRGLVGPVRALGLAVTSLDKFIPEQYLTASVQQRTDLLNGLLDADGERVTSPSGGGTTRYCTSSHRLAKDVQALVWSLGGTATIKARATTHAEHYRVSIRLPISLGCPFTTTRKVAQWEASQPVARTGREPSRRVVSVEPEGVSRVRCISVENEDGLYVIENYIVTHNSAWLSYLALKDWERGRNPVLVTLENSIEMTEMRIACQALHLSYRDLERGTLKETEVEILTEWVNDVLLASDNPLHILRPPEGQRTSVSLVQQAKALEATTLLVDQLTFVDPVRHRKDGSKAYEVAETMRHFKVGVSTGRHQMPLILAHQITRDGIKTANATGRLGMTSMADSSEVERAADLLFGLYASEEQRVHNSLQLQALAVRRVEPVSFDLHWHIHQGLVGVQHVLTEEDLDG